MRSACLLLILVIAIHVSDNLAAECCPAGNCVPADHCESPWIGPGCEDERLTCCSVVKSEYRTLCHHHGGECMRRCNINLQRNVTDCPADKVCCVLV